MNWSVQSQLSFLAERILVGVCATALQMGMYLMPRGLGLAEARFVHYHILETPFERAAFGKGHGLFATGLQLPKRRYGE